MDGRTSELLTAVRDASAPPDAVRDAWRALFDLDPAVAAAAAFDLLAGEPRLKPSHRLLVDPQDSARRRWERRVAAAVGLLAAPVATRVFDELHDELAEDPDLVADVLATAVPNQDLSDAQRRALERLRGRPGRG